MSKLLVRYRDANGDAREAKLYNITFRDGVFHAMQDIRGAAVRRSIEEKDFINPPMELLRLKAPQPEPLFDVVIYCIETRKVDTMAGANMRRSGRDGSFSQNAEKRMNTCFERINDRYSVSIVKAGQYKVGDTLAEKDL